MLTTPCDNRSQREQQWRIPQYPSGPVPPCMPQRSLRSSPHRRRARRVCRRAASRPAAPVLARPDWLAEPPPSAPRSRAPQRPFATLAQPLRLPRRLPAPPRPAAPATSHAAPRAAPPPQVLTARAPSTPRSRSHSRQGDISGSWQPVLSRCVSLPGSDRLGDGAGRTRARYPVGQRGRGGLVPCRPGPRRVEGRGRCLVRIPVAWPGSRADVPVPARPAVLHNRRTARRRPRRSNRSRQAATDPAGGSTPRQACPLLVASLVTTAWLGRSCAHRPRPSPTRASRACAGGSARVKRYRPWSDAADQRFPYLLGVRICPEAGGIRDQDLAAGRGDDVGQRAGQVGAG
jgi:hypothetical protein